MAQAPASLTFGVEFELIIATLPPKTSDPHPTDPRNPYFPVTLVPNHLEILHKMSEDGDDYETSEFLENGAVAQQIADVLKANGIPAFPWFRQLYSTFSASEEDRKGWQIVTDASIRLNEDEATPFCEGGEKRDADPYAYVGIEVVSPIMRRGFTDDAAADDADLEEVSRVARILTDHFRAFCNWSTGLHVHVGNGTDGFEIRTLQKLLGFLYAFEPGIEKVHPRNRRTAKTAGYCAPLRSRLHVDYRKEKGWVVVNEIMSAPNLRDLGRLIDGWGGRKGEDGGTTHKYSAYNLENLVWKFTGKRTVEFRQHSGTLNPGKVRLWAKFVVILVAWVMRTRWSEVYRVAKGEVDRQERGEGYMMIDQICTGLGYQEGATGWADVREGREETEELPEQDQMLLGKSIEDETDSEESE